MLKFTLNRIYLSVGLALSLFLYSYETNNNEVSKNKLFLDPSIHEDSLSFQPSYGFGFFEHFRLEMELERFLRHQLSSYINPNTFFLSIKFDPNGTTDTTAFQSLTPELLTKPSLEGLNMPSSNQSKLNPNKLPGLPEYWNRNPNSGFDNDNDNSLKDYEKFLDLEKLILEEMLLGSLKVHFIIDPVIDKRIQELLYKLSYYSLKLYAFESYDITFEEIPTYNLLSNLQQDSIKDTVTVAQIDDVGFSDKQNKSNYLGLLEDLIRNEFFIPLVLVIVLLGIFLIMFLLGIKRQKSVSKEIQILKKEYESNESEKSDIQQENDPIQTITEEKINISLENFQDFFVNHTSEIGKVFSYWIEDLGEDGLKKVHSILMPMGKNMYTLLFPYLSKDSTVLLLKSFHKNLPLTDKEERNHYLIELVEIIKTQLGINSLAILKSLDKKELFGLIDLLDNKEASMALYHMDQNLRVEYLQKTLSDRSAEILISMVDIRSMNLDDFEKLGETLSQKLYDLRFFKKYHMEDLDFIIESIDLIDEEKQKYILESFKVKDPVFFRQLQKFIISWSDLQQLKPVILRDATLNFSSEELSKAYPLRPTELDLIISLRPKREQQLINDLISKKSVTSVDDAKLILSRILKSIKDKIRANEINYPEAT